MEMRIVSVGSVDPLGTPEDNANGAYRKCLLCGDGGERDLLKDQIRLLINLVQEKGEDLGVQVWGADQGHTCSKCWVLVQHVWALQQRAFQIQAQLLQVQDEIDEEVDKICQALQRGRYKAKVKKEPGVYKAEDDSTEETDNVLEYENDEDIGVFNEKGEGRTVVDDIDELYPSAYSDQLEEMYGECDVQEKLRKSFPNQGSSRASRLCDKTGINGHKVTVKKDFAGPANRTATGVKFNVKKSIAAARMSAVKKSNLIKTKSININAAERSGQCSFCGKILRNFRHRIHHEISVCKVEYSDADLQRLNVTLQKCDVCGKTFAEKKDLQRHRSTHLEDKPFACTKCDASFTDQSYLRKHMKTYNHEANKLNTTTKRIKQKLKVTSKKSKPNGVVAGLISKRVKPPRLPHSSKTVCNICGKSVTFGSLRHHVRRLHEKVLRYFCTHCGKGFYEAYERQRHILRNHDIVN